jgi:hypothetical protein
MTALVATLLLLGEPADLIAALRSTDHAERLRAVQQVERLGAEGAPDEVYLAPLAGLLRDTDLQTRGLAALALWRHVPACKGRVPEGVILPLLLAHADQNPYVALYSGKTLSSLGERCIPQLRAAVDAEQPHAQRLAALEGCRHLATVPGCREPIDALLWSLLTDRVVAVRERAFLVLRLLRAEHNLSPMRDTARLATLLRVEDERIRAFAGVQLAALKDRAVPVLMELLEDDNRAGRTEAVRVVARLLEGGMVLRPEQATRLLRAAERTDPAELASIRGILTTFTREAEAVRIYIDDIKRHLKTIPERPPESFVTTDPTLELALGLARVPRPAALLEGLRSDDLPARLGALQHVERLGATGALEAAYVPALARLIHDPDGSVRELAAAALAFHIGACRGQVSDDVASAILLGLRDENPRVATSLGRALGEHEPVALALNGLLFDPDANNRTTASILLVAHLNRDPRTAKQLLPILARALRSPRWETRRAAALAVRAAMLPGVEASWELLLGLRMGVDSDDKPLRRACVEGLAACGKAAEDTLCDLLEYKAVEAQRCSVEAILLMVYRTQYTPRRTAPYLRRLLNSPDAGLRQAVAAALSVVDPTFCPEKKP